MSSMSLSSVNGASSQLANMWQSMFTSMDTNSDGTVSKDEFVLARPKEVGADQASALYDKIDTTGSGALTEDQLAQGMQANAPDQKDAAGLGNNMTGEILALLMQLAQQESQNQNGSNAAPTANGSVTASGQPAASARFSQMDTNGDGTVSKDEFVAARPKYVSTDKASALYDKIDTAGTGALTAEQLAQGMQANAPHRQHGSHHGELADDIQALLMQLAQQGSQAQNGSDLSSLLANGSIAASGQSAASAMFSKMDINGDGTVSKDEFVAAAAAQATSLYNSIDTQGTGSITVTQLADSMNNGSAQPAVTPASASSGIIGSSSADDTSNAKNDMLLFRLLQALQAYAYHNGSNNNADATASSLLSTTA